MKNQNSNQKMTKIELKNSNRTTNHLICAYII